MNAEAKAVMRECTEGSDAGRLSFPEVIGKLMAVGVERYHADLVRGEKTYYLPDDQSEVLGSETVAGPAARSFSAAGVEAAVRAIQGRKIQYREFCQRIAEAGCVGYFVTLSGRRAVYYGRDAETYMEPFPAAN
jgi:uncharacterized protein YbcV (DUF1398 family)